MQPHKSLGDQCIQSEGLAQIKLELKQLRGNNRINIIDVLKYPEDSGSDGKRLNSGLNFTLTIWHSLDLTAKYNRST